MDTGPELSRTYLITLGWSGNMLTGVLIFRKENSMKQIKNGIAKFVRLIMNNVVAILMGTIGNVLIVTACKKFK